MAGSETAAATGATGLAKHRLLAELGHGGMAEVFLAVVCGPAGFNKLLVIKQIRPQLAEEPEFLGMFLDEARLAARLNHRNVVQTNEVGQQNGRYFIAMEYLEGQPLNRVLHRFQKVGGLPLDLHLRVVSEVLAGLHHAHELADYDGTPLGVVHRDVTPHNIFITYDGQVKVVDFGIAKALNSSSETRSGVLKGKVAYMAPEQARGEQVDRRADLFSVGVVLWEAVTGRRLWKGVPDLTILQRLLKGEIPTPRSVSPAVPEALEAIILKCLARDRDERYATALDLQADLDAHLDAQEERGSARDLGKLISKQFDVDRIKIRGIIEEQLRGKPSTSPHVESHRLPVLDAPMSLSSSGSIPPSGDRLSFSSPGSAQPSSSGRISGSASPSSTGPSSLFVSAETSNEEDAHPRRRLFKAAAALAAGGLLVLGLWGITRDPAASTRLPAAALAPAATPAATTVVAPSPPPAVAQIEISIAASPPEARIFLDDRPLERNPFKGTLPVDAGPHQLRIEARGHATQSKSITLDRNLVLELALQKDVGAEKLPGRLPAPASAPAADNDAMTRPGVKPRRTLDTSNPYAR
ncbi:MAG: serine/threonine-protein kinase [Byssovorax sp.]